MEQVAGAHSEAGGEVKGEMRGEVRLERSASGRPSRLALFLRSSIFDFLLVLVVSSALVFTISYGFNSAPDLRGKVGVIAIADAIVLACLYLGAWSKRTLPISAAAYIVASVAIVAVIGSLSPEQVPLFADGQLNDIESNYAVFGIVAVIVPLFVYLLSRRTWGVAVLLLLGALSCGIVQFLYRDWVASEPGTLAAVIALAGIGALFVVQGYRQGVLAARHVQRTSFLGSFVLGVIVAALSVLMSAGLFFGIVSVLGFSTVDVKPFEDYYQRPVIEYNGTYQQQTVIDPDLGTSVLSDEEGDTLEDASRQENEQEEESGGGFTLMSVIQDTLNIDNWNSMFDAIRFDIPPSLIALLILIPILLIVLAVLLRRRVRTRRLRKLEERPIPERVAFLYEWFMSRFKRLKITKADHLTPLEFALMSGKDLAGFAHNASHTDFLGVTLLYQRAAYGAGNISEEEYGKMVDYYNAFFKNAKARTSLPKWAFWRFWRI